MIADFNKHSRKQIQIINIVFVFFYVFIAALESTINFDSIGYRIIWFSAGVAFAVLIIYGKRMLPAILIASIFYNLISYFTTSYASFSEGLITFILISFGPVLQAFWGYKLIDSFQANYDFLGKGRDAFIFILIAAIIGSVNSTIFILFPTVNMAPENVKVLEIWGRIWLSDSLGVLIMTPIILAIFKNKRIDSSLAGVSEIFSIFTLTIIFTQLLFGGWVQKEIAHSLPFLIILFILWVAFRFTPRETSLITFIVSFASLFGLMESAAIFNLMDGTISLIGLQLYLAVITIVGLILSVSVQEKKQILQNYKEMSNSLEKRVIKRTDELATLNKELLVEVISRKKAEAELKESEERNTALLSSLPDTIFLHDKNGHFLDYRSVDHSKLFFNPNDIIGKSIEEVLPAKISGPLKKVFFKTLNSQDTQSFEYSMTIDDKEKYYEARFSNCGENRVMSVVRDITERRIAEEERKQMEDQVRHSQKLESLGVLAGGIAHDFNNLLTAIMGNTGLAIMGLPNNSKVINNLDRIENASLRAADLCRQLLAYSGKGKFIIDSVNLNVLVKEMSNLLLVSISKKVELICTFDENIKLFEADSTQVRQIIMNLITNASEAIGEKTGKIKIKTAVEACTKSFLKNSYFDDSLDAGKYVSLEVTDNGIGMDKETTSKIFDPFFSTKFTGRGLGLAAVVGIVRSHKGAIIIESKLKKGTKFKIYFPVSKAVIIKKVSKNDKSTDWKGKGTVLVVDDEESIRHLGLVTLKGAGLDVITAVDGKEAVDIYKKKSKEINLVLMDLTMPKLSGEEAFLKLRKIRSDVKVILSSGYSEQEATKKFNTIGLQGFLQKPYKPSDLIEKVKQILERTN